jgi:hypothetical protein
MTPQDFIKAEAEKLRNGKRRQAAGAATVGAGKQERESAADVLVRIALAGCDLWHDPTESAYATVGRRSFAVAGDTFRKWLLNKFRKQHDGKVASGEAMTNAVNAIAAVAVFDKPQHTAHVRVAGHGGSVYVYLADTDHTVIEIGPDGWRECERPPVKFVHPKTAAALPKPTRGGSLDPLRSLLNLEDDDQWSLILAWLVGVYLPDGPFPILALSGEQGASKTTTARVLKAITDPL